MRPLHNLCGDFARIDRPRTFGRQPLERVCVGGILERVALLQGRTVRPCEQCPNLGCWRDRRVARQKSGQAAGHVEAFAGRTDCGREEILPRQRSQLGVGGRKQRESPGNTRRASAAHCLKKRQRLSVLVEKHVRRGPGRRSLAAVQRGNDACRGVVVQEERTSADSGALRLNQTEHCLDCDRCVDSAAALAQNFNSRIRRERVRGSHHCRNSGWNGSARRNQPQRSNRKHKQTRFQVRHFQVGPLSKRLKR